MEPPEKQQPCILVVDDDAVVRKVLGEMLRINGYQVVEAADGRQALASFKQHSIDLLITDLVMPELEGIETIKTFRRDYPHVRIIAMSGAFGGEYLTIAGLLGAHSTIQKPLRLETVLRTVQEALAG